MGVSQSSTPGVAARYSHTPFAAASNAGRPLRGQLLPSPVSAAASFERPMVSGSISIIYRNFSPSYFPAAEAGPAVVVSNLRVVGWSTTKWYWSDLTEGDAQTAAEGVIACAPLKTVVLSDYMPPLGASENPPNWVCWPVGTGFPRRALACFDAIVVFRPRAQFPRLTIMDASKRILDLACGGGAVYSAASIEKMEIRAGAQRA